MTCWYVRASLERQRKSLLLIFAQSLRIKFQIQPLLLNWIAPHCPAKGHPCLHTVTLGILISPRHGASSLASLGSHLKGSCRLTLRSIMVILAGP